MQWIIEFVDKNPFVALFLAGGLATLIREVSCKWADAWVVASERKAELQKGFMLEHYKEQMEKQAKSLQYNAERNSRKTEEYSIYYREVFKLNRSLARKNHGIKFHKRYIEKLEIALDETQHGKGRHTILRANTKKELKAEREKK